MFTKSGGALLTNVIDPVVSFWDLMRGLAISCREIELCDFLRLGHFAEQFFIAFIFR